MNQKPEFENQPLKGALFVLASSFVFALMGGVVKELSVSVSNPMIVFFRNIFALGFMVLWLRHHQSFAEMKTGVFRFHLLRSLSGLASMYCFFYTISQMQFAEAVLLSFTYPLFMPIMAYLWLNEPVSPHVRSAIIIGFIGMALIVKPGGDLFRPISLIGISSGILVSFSMVGIRRMSATEPSIRIVFYFTLISAIMSAFPLMWTAPIRFGVKEFFLLILTGLFAVIGQLLLTRGYSLAPAAQVGPFGYGNVVFSAVIGWLFWDEALDHLTFIGAMLICAAGILSTWRRNVLPEVINQPH